MNGPICSENRQLSSGGCQALADPTVGTAPKSPAMRRRRGSFEPTPAAAPHGEALMSLGLGCWPWASVQSALGVSNVRTKLGEQL